MLPVALNNAKMPGAAISHSILGASVSRWHRARPRRGRSGHGAACRQCRGYGPLVHTSWAKDSSPCPRRRACRAAKGRPAAHDHGAPWTIGTELLDRSPRPASARSWPRKTCSWSGFACCPAARGRSKSPRFGTGQGPFGSKPAQESIDPGRTACRPPGRLSRGVGRFELRGRGITESRTGGPGAGFSDQGHGAGGLGNDRSSRPGALRRLGLGLRIEPRPDETTDEPPARTFVYRLRPTQAGEVVLPPVAIAAFDPSLARYVTHVTAGVPIRVVAVPSFDPATIAYDPPSTAMSRPAADRMGRRLAGDLSCRGFISSCDGCGAGRRLSVRPDGRDSRNRRPDPEVLSVAKHDRPNGWRTRESGFDSDTRILDRLRLRVGRRSMPPDEFTSF